MKKRERAEGAEKMIYCCNRVMWTQKRQCLVPSPTSNKASSVISLSVTEAKYGAHNFQ